MFRPMMPEPTITTSADAAAEENDRVVGLPNGLLSSRRVADMAVPLAAADIKRMSLLRASMKNGASERGVS